MTEIYVGIQDQFMRPVELDTGKKTFCNLKHGECPQVSFALSQRAATQQKTRLN